MLIVLVVNGWWLFSTFTAIKIFIIYLVEVIVSFMRMMHSSSKHSGKTKTTKNRAMINWYAWTQHMPNLFM